MDLVVGPILACCAHTAEGTGGGTVSHVLSCAGMVRAWSCPLGHPHTSVYATHHDFTVQLLAHFCKCWDRSHVHTALQLCMT